MKEKAKEKKKRQQQKKKQQEENKENEEVIHVILVFCISCIEMTDPSHFGLQSVIFLFFNFSSTLPVGFQA